MGGAAHHAPSRRRPRPPTSPSSQDVGMDLSTLTESERDAILAVLERDHHLREYDRQRIYRLKTELSWLRRRGAVRVDENEGRSSATTMVAGTTRTCGRCRVELGLIINRGAVCRACRQRVCKQCRHFNANGSDWVCLVCHKHIEIQLASGEWMNEFVRRPSRRRENKVYVPPADVVKRSLITRSWTISSPASVERISPELQATSTLHKAPRGHRTPTDENEPPWDAPQYPPRWVSPRRYSMSSFDAVSPDLQHLKSPAPPLPSLSHCQEDSRSPDSYILHHQPSFDSPPVPQRRRLLPDLPQEHVCEERPSTLPRKHRQAHDHNPADNSRLSPSLAHDPARFHSMPRSRVHSPSRAGRERSQPSRRPHSPAMPLTENLGGYISSGPITSTPITHDPAFIHHRRSTSQPMAAPREHPRPHASGRPPDQGTPTSQVRRSPQTSGQGVTRIIEIEVEQEDGSFTSSRGPASRTSSALSASSRCTSDNSDYDGDAATAFGKMPPSRSRQAASPPVARPRQSASPPSARTHPASSPPMLHPHQATSPPTIRTQKAASPSGSNPSRASSSPALQPLQVLVPSASHPPWYSASPPMQHPRLTAAPSPSHPCQGTSPPAAHHRQSGSPATGLPRQFPPMAHPRLPPNTPPLLTSGFATTGRPRRASHGQAGVRRSRSFQVGSPRVDDEYPAPLSRESLSGQVARYVKELERGIQMTVENMMPKKQPLSVGEHPRAPSSPSKDSSHSGRSLGRRPKDKTSTGSPSDTGTSKAEFDDRCSNRHSDHSSHRHSDTASDIVLDAEKILPEGDDYKLVFISSDSSKDSELNSSIDSDNSGSPSRRVSSVSAVNDSDNAGFIDESDWDYYESESQAGRRRKLNGVTPRVDACVMTDGEYLSVEASEGEDSEPEPSKVKGVSPAPALRVPSPAHHNSGTDKMTQKGMGAPNGPGAPASAQPLIMPLTAMDTNELHAMLRQTEAVQAEAQALQAALMGAFTPSASAMTAISGGRSFKRGDSTRSSAERSLGELSCHDQVRAAGSPHDSPALREYRKRVLTEIQNYYGVNQGTTVTGYIRPDWYSYLTQHQPAASVPPGSLSRVSYQRRDKGSKHAAARDQGSSVTAAPTAPASARKSSRDICIQTDPELVVLSSSCDELTPEPQECPPIPPRRNELTPEPPVCPPVPPRRNELTPEPPVCPSESPRRNKLTPEPSSESPRRNKLTPEPPVCPSESPRRNKLTPGSLSESPRRNKLTPEPSSESPRRNTLTPEPPSESPRRNKLTPEPPVCPSESPRRNKLTPEPLSESPRRNKLTPEPLSESPRRNKLTPEPQGNSQASSRLVRGLRHTHSPQTAARLSSLTQGVPPRTQGYTASCGSGGGDGGVGGGGGGGGGGGDREREGEELPPHLPYPPSFHLHLTLSRETSVAHPSDTETDDRLKEYDPCVGSELRADSVSDLECSERLESARSDPKEEQERQDGRRGVIGGRGRKEQDGGRGGGGQEVPRSPRIAATNTTHTPACRTARPPPQPAPTMSLSRPHRNPTRRVLDADGDLDALERVIQADSSSSSASARVPHPGKGLDTPSSTTSEAEDTDEDVHVSRSYTIVPDEVDSEAEGVTEVGNISNIIENEQQDITSSSSDDSDTDEDKHFSKEYSLTRSSSTDSDLDKSDTGALEEITVFTTSSPDVDEDVANMAQGVKLGEVRPKEAEKDEVVEAVNTDLTLVVEAGEVGLKEAQQEAVEAINEQLCDLTLEPGSPRYNEAQVDLGSSSHSGGGGVEPLGPSERLSGDLMMTRNVDEMCQVDVSQDLDEDVHSVLTKSDDSGGAVMGEGESGGHAVMGEGESGGSAVMREGDSGGSAVMGEGESAGSAVMVEEVTYEGGNVVMVKGDNNESAVMVKSDNSESAVMVTGDNTESAVMVTGYNTERAVMVTGDNTESAVMAEEITNKSDDSLVMVEELTTVFDGETPNKNVSAASTSVGGASENSTIGMTDLGVTSEVSGVGVQGGEGAGASEHNTTAHVTAVSATPGVGGGGGAAHLPTTHSEPTPESLLDSLAIDTEEVVAVSETTSTEEVVGASEIADTEELGVSEVTEEGVTVSEITEEVVATSEATEEVVDATEEVVAASEATEEVVDASDATEEVVAAPETTEEVVATSEATEEVVDATEEVVAAPETTEEVVDASETTEEVVAASEVTEEVVDASDATEEVVAASEVTEEVVDATEEVVAAPETTEEVVAASDATEEVVAAPEVTEEVVDASDATENVVAVSETTEEVVAASEVTEEVVTVSETTEEVLALSEVTEEVVAASEDTEEVVAASEVTDKEEVTAGGITGEAAATVDGTGAAEPTSPEVPAVAQETSPVGEEAAAAPGTSAPLETDTTEDIQPQVSAPDIVSCGRPSPVEGAPRPPAAEHASESIEHCPGESEGAEYGGECQEAAVGESPGPASTRVDAGSEQVEHSTAAPSCGHTSVTHAAPAGPHASALAPHTTSDVSSAPADAAPPGVLRLSPHQDIFECYNTEVKSVCAEGDSSESGHSSAGESEVEGDDPGNVVKISVTERHDSHLDDDGVSIPVSVVGSDFLGQEVRRFAVRRVRSPEPVRRHTPPVPSRRTKRSSSSDGVSSSSDIERSDADASDSADTVVEGGKLHAELRRFALQKHRHDHDDKGRDSDGPSSADSVLHGADSESQCSDNSEEGNLVSIVSVGDEDDHSTRLSSHGRIYIRSDSTDSDVQIKPTCIVVTGSSGAESGEDVEGDADGINSQRNIKNEGNDVTILEVTSDARRGHVMSVHVTSPDSSRSASPARRSQVSELQSMILTTRERQQQFRRSPTEMKESNSSLANYFTLTLGTDSPHAPRRLNKTPEIRRRKIDRPENVESPVPTSPASPSQTPDHSEGDLLAYEEHHGIDIEEEYNNTQEFDSWDDGEKTVIFPDEVEFEEDLSFDEVNQAFNDGDEFEGEDMYVEQEVDGRFDSIEDGESVNSESNYSESSGDEICDREVELRGYCNRAIDFTLHTIIEESCEESDYERKPKEEDGAKADPSELEKYFYFGLGNGPADSKRYANEESEYSDTFSETSSSIFSEGVDIDCKYEEDIDPAELASSRLEKYFLTGFLGFERQPSIRSMGEESELHTDESGSVGSDSEGSPSPEQPRKKLVRRPRGFRPGVVNRSLVTGDRWDGAPSDGSHHSEGDDVDRTLVSGEDDGSTESEETAFDKGDGQFDTIKRRKKKKGSGDYCDKKSDSDKSELRALEQHEIEHREEICELKNSEALKSLVHEGEKVTKRVTIECDKESRERNDDKMEREGDLSDRKYLSRDSGFIGSSDDLLKDKPEDTNKEQKSRLSSESSVEDGENSSKRNDHLQDVSHKNVAGKGDSFDNDSNNNKSETEERSSGDGKVSRSSTGSSVDFPPFSADKARNKICRKDSFNNWSSDEETNMMMNKMRAFFKTMISNSRDASKGQRVKPPQLLAFEAKLTNLMKTVPGINDEQVKEIVEYLSSEDTWSDSYDSSDYTSSDLEGAYALLDQADPEMRSDLQEQISASCQQIIQKFDQSREPSDTDSAHSLFGGRACSESSEDASPSNKDTVFVYQRLMSSISRLKPDSDRGSIGSGSQGASPPLLAKVMHHIGNRLVALMHEVSGGSENGDDDSLSGGHPVTSSPKVPLFIHRKHTSVDSISIDSSVEKSSLTSTSFESEDSPTDTEQSPDSDPGTPKARKRQGPLSIISERSSAEDFTSLESQRTVFASHDSPRHQTHLDTARPQQNTASERTLEERGVTNIQYFVTGISKNEVEVWQSVTIDEDKFDARELHGVPRARRSARRQETRKAKSHMSLEKIHQEEVKATGERSESLGDLLDRVRSSEFSSSYEQLDSDSTLKASDSLDRHIGSSSSNIRLNASSRGSLTTSSRGSLAASSRGSLNAGSRGSLQGSSGPEEEEEKKPKKLNFFRYARRSSMPDTSKDRMSPEVRSTTLPRSNPTQVASTASLPRSQFALLNKVTPSVTPSTHVPYASPPSTLERAGLSVSGPRSARYHAPGYRPPPSTTTPKRTVSIPGLASLRKDSTSSWSPQGKIPIFILFLRCYALDSLTRGRSGRG
ncbi:serine-rich adhesin for platelets isoform X3 [Procambarus clarkii]|uniref:serine-rich adhesin for platelets isoform X3 n=1 Tax=Procambarus clarkii TaxID=6728 RepID=UPI003743AD46